ncbi:hypothetical protein O988_03078 [Pseudogymnoascus sp. VKM F-3808]|nr:hypothetical protein O988_03078 [Pseudogymnoascus sp. VKM F-3808]
MVRLSLLAVLVAASLTPADAFKWTAAKPTPPALPVPSIAHRFKPPKPTQAPDAPYDLLKRGAVRRADTSSGAITAFAAPDATCGYFDGRAGAPLHCGTADTCFMFTTAGGNGFIGCCPISGPFEDCGFRTDCIDAAHMANGTYCDSGCLHDAYTLKCTESSAPYCAAVTWPANGVADFFCDDEHITTTQIVYTNYKGQTGNTWLTTTISDNTLTTSRTTTGDDNNSHAAQPTGDSSSSSDSDANPTSGSDNGDDGSDTSNSHTTSKKKKTPIGPIVGGVVGGLAALFIIGLLIFFYLRRKKAAAATAGTTPAAAAAAQQPQGPVGPQGPPAYIPDANKPPLNPNTNSYYGPQNGEFAAGQYGGPEMQQQQQAQQYPQPQYPQQPPQQPQGGYYDPQTGTYYAPVPQHPQGSPNPTSPTTTAVSGQTNDVIAGGGVRDSSATGSTGAYGYTSPRPGFSEMSANMAGGPFPSDQHEGTYEVEGSRPAVRAPPGEITELDGGRPAGR